MEKRPWTFILKGSEMKRGATACAYCFLSFSSGEEALIFFNADVNPGE